MTLDELDILLEQRGFERSRVGSKPSIWINPLTPVDKIFHPDERIYCTRIAERSELSTLTAEELDKRMSVTAAKMVDDMLVGKRDIAELENLLRLGYFWLEGYEINLEDDGMYLLSQLSYFDSHEPIDKTATLAELLERHTIDLQDWRWFGAKWS